MQKLIVANWKANKNLVASEHFLNNFPKELAEKLRQNSSQRVLIAPPYPVLGQMQRLIKHQALPIELAVQDLSAFGAGAFTGEVAAENLEFLGVKMAILGHSERRRLLKESSQLISDKIRQALIVDMEVLLCVDEDNFIEQAKLLTSTERSLIKVAYEPLKAIGSGQALQAEAVGQFFTQLRAFFPENQLLYGGSVKANNIQDFLKISDGVLIGGASLQLETFVPLLQNCLL